MSELVTLALALAGALAFLANKKPEIYGKIFPIISGILSVGFIGGLFYNLGFIDGASSPDQHKAPVAIWLASGASLAGLLYCLCLAQFFGKGQILKNRSREASKRGGKNNRED